MEEMECLKFEPTVLCGDSFAENGMSFVENGFLYLRDEKSYLGKLETWLPVPPTNQC